MSTLSYFEHGENVFVRGRKQGPERLVGPGLCWRTQWQGPVGEIVALVSDDFSTEFCKVGGDKALGFISFSLVVFMGTY